MFHGGLLPGILQSNGIVKSWGTAILANSEFVTPLSPSVCTIYHSLFESKRVVAVWVQVAPKVQLLVFSVYAKTSASKFPEIHEENDCLLGQIFECAAQFGPVPVIVCGDFQLNPRQYHSVSAAVNHHSWVDPLVGVDDAGELCTSIDGILCNHIAFSALRHIGVLELKVQHRPIRALLEWDRITQVGYTLIKPAPFNLDQCTVPDSDPLCPCHNNAVHLWTSPSEQAFHAATSVDDKWRITNQYFIQVLTANGGTWEHGPRHRGSLPSFCPTRICPGQTARGDALSRKAKRIARAVNILREVSLRLARPVKSFEDGVTLARSLRKARAILAHWSCPHVWAFNHYPTLVQVSDCLSWLEGVLSQVTRATRQGRVQVWKEKMKASANGNMKYIFQHLKQKASDELPNLITDSADHIIYQPLDALAEFNSQWDEVFGINALHEDPQAVLKVIWPYVSHLSHQAQIPEITARDLCDQIHRRKPEAAPGLDMGGERMSFKDYRGSLSCLLHLFSIKLNRSYPHSQKC